MRVLLGGLIGLVGLLGVVEWFGCLCRVMTVTRGGETICDTLVRHVSLLLRGSGLGVEGGLVG